MDQQPTLDADLPATDPAALDRLRRFGGGKLLVEMIRLFLESGPQRVAAMHTGLAQGDSESVERALHSLKSSAAQLGALRLQRLAERGERLAKAGTLEAVSAQLSQLEQELAHVNEWLVLARDEGTA